MVDSNFYNNESNINDFNILLAFIAIKTKIKAIKQFSK